MFIISRVYLIEGGKKALPFQSQGGVLGNEEVSRIQKRTVEIRVTMGQRDRRLQGACNEIAYHYQQS